MKFVEARMTYGGRKYGLCCALREGEDPTRVRNKLRTMMMKAIKMAVSNTRRGWPRKKVRHG